MFRLSLIALLSFGLSGAMAQTLVSGPQVVVNVQDLESDLLSVPPDVRANTFSRPTDVQNNVSNMYVRRVLAAEAVSKGMDQVPSIKAALDLARDRVLSDARLSQIDQAALPSPEAVEAYAQSTYKADPKRFEGPEQVRVRHILRRVSESDARSQAEQILKALKAGADFEQIAKARSQDTGSASLGGDLGLISRGRLVKPFEDAAFNLSKPGELSEVIETNFGFHIIKLEERRPAGIRSFDDVKDGLVKEVQGKLISNARLKEQDRILEAAKFDTPAIEAFAKAQGK
jgi:peptidyl-prolyl cis-trans isomerase C